MKSKPTGSGEIGLPSQYNSARDDARAASFLLPHQQLGAMAMGTNPTNGQTETITINGATAIVITYVTAIGSTPNNILIQGTAALTNAAKINFLRRPDLTNANQIAATSANQALLQYVGWALPSGGTTITPYSLNKNVNGANAPLTSFTASTTVTGASWTAQTMQLYIEEGAYYIGTTRVLFSGGSTPTFTAPVSHPRIDIVTADSSGTIAITQGSENVSPTAPSYPANKVVICEVWNVVGETGIYDTENQQSGQGYISNDVRATLTPIYISATSQVASGLFLVDPGGEAQGAIPFQGSAALQFLAPGAAGQFLVTGGPSANLSWGSGAGSLRSFSAGFTQAGNSNEQTIDSFTLAANSLGTSHIVHGRYYSTGFGATSGTTTLRAYYGSTVIASIVTASAVGENTFTGWIDFYIIAGSSTSAQNGTLDVFITNATGNLVLADTFVYRANGTAAVDSTSSQTIKLTVQASSVAGITAIPFGFVEYL